MWKFHRFCQTCTRTLINVRHCHQSTVIHDAIKIKSPNEIYQIWQQVKADELAIDEQLVHMLQNDRIENAKQFFDVVAAGNACSYTTYSNMIHHLCKTYDTSSAMQLLQDMEARNLSPDAFQYASIMTGLANKGNLEAMKQLHLKMKTKQISFDLVFYNAYLTGLVKLDQLETAEDIFHEIIQNNIVPDFITAKLMIKTFSKLDERDKCYQILTQATTSITKSDATALYNIYVECYLELRNYSEIDFIVEEMFENEIYLWDESWKVICSMYKQSGDFVLLSEKLGKLNKLKRPVFEHAPISIDRELLAGDALSFIEYMKELSDQKYSEIEIADFCHQKIIQLFTSGKINEGYELMELIEKNVPVVLPIDTYNSVLSKLIDEHQYTKAKAFYEQFAENVFVKADKFTYNLLLKLYGKLDASKIEEICMEMNERHFAGDIITLNTILFAYSSSRRKDAIEKSKQIICEMVGVTPTIISYNTLLKTCANQQNWNEFIRIASEIRNKAVQFDKQTYAIILNAVIHMHKMRVDRSKLLDYSDAFYPDIKNSLVKNNTFLIKQILFAIRDQAMRENIREPEIYNCILKFFVLKNDPNGMFKTVEQMQQNIISLNIVTWNLIITGYQRMGNMREAENVLRSLAEPTCRSFKPFIVHYASLKDFESAKSWYSQMCSTVKGPIDYSLRKQLESMINPH